MDLKKKKRITRLIVHLVLLVLTLVIVVVYVVQPKHTALQTAGFAVYFLIAITILQTISRPEK